MSGIAGVIRFDGGPVEPGLVETMTSSMAYRGPDGVSHWRSGSVALGQCMTRTTPESLEETQPLANEDESQVLVMDGWLSNWEELRAEVLAKGGKLRTRADAELVLRSYELWGENCLDHLEGDFAFVVWDARKNQAFCARDRIGAKPFIYFWDGTTFIFASEPHAILTVPGVPEIFNEGMAAEFIACDWLSRDETFWRGIMRLGAAHKMQVNAAGARLEKYWGPDYWGTLPYVKEEDFVRHYRDLLYDQVRRHARSHAPLACEVSGGLDSSALFAVADDLLRKGRLPAPGLEGFTLAFAGEADADELEYCRSVADHVGRPIAELAPSAPTLDWFREYGSRSKSFPYYPNGVMGLGIRQKARENGSRALMCGVGGDQWLTGDLSYYADAIGAGRWNELVSLIVADRRDFGAISIPFLLLRHGLYPLLPESVRRAARFISKQDRPAGVDLESLLTSPMRNLLRERRERSRDLSDERTRWISQRGRRLMLTGAYSALARELEEKMASGVGIELRQPLFSAAMVQFAFSTPEKWLRRGKTDKYLHRQAMKGLLPEKVRQRQSKAEFTCVYEAYRLQLVEELRKKTAGGGVPWIEDSKLSTILRRDDADDTEIRAVKLRVMWNLFGCLALSGRPDDEEAGHGQGESLLPQRGFLGRM